MSMSVRLPGQRISLQTQFFVNMVVQGPRVRMATSSEIRLVSFFFQDDGGVDNDDDNDNSNEEYDQLFEKIQVEQRDKRLLKIKENLNTKTLPVLCELVHANEQKVLEYESMKKVEDERPNHFDMTNEDDVDGTWSRDILKEVSNKFEKEDTIMIIKLQKEVIEEKIREKYAQYDCNQLKKHIEKIQDDILIVEKSKERLNFRDVFNMCNDEDEIESEHENAKKKIEEIEDILIMRRKKSVFKIMLAEEIVCLKYPDYVCPIGLVVMHDPVRTKNGHCYERKRYQYSILSTEF